MVSSLLLLQLLSLKQRLAMRHLISLERWMDAGAAHSLLLLALQLFQLLPHHVLQLQYGKHNSSSSRSQSPGTSIQTMRQKAMTATNCQ